MVNNVSRYFNLTVKHFSNISANTLGWLAIVLMHCAFIPNLLSVLMGISDRLPSVDIVIFVWVGLLLFFLRSTLIKDTLGIVTGGIGFFIQAGLLALVVFK